jgi:hypothetical protein
VGPNLWQSIGSERVKISPPKSWSIAGLNAMELESLGKIDWITVEHGGQSDSETIIFEGENIVSVWNSSPARLVFDAPTSYDEFVIVLKGELILTGNAEMLSLTKRVKCLCLKKVFWEPGK